MFAAEPAKFVANLGRRKAEHLNEFALAPIVLEAAREGAPMPPCEAHGRRTREHLENFPREGRKGVLQASEGCSISIATRERPVFRAELAA